MFRKAGQKQMKVREEIKIQSEEQKEALIRLHLQSLTNLINIYILDKKHFEELINKIDIDRINQIINIIPYYNDRFSQVLSALEDEAHRKENLGKKISMKTLTKKMSKPLKQKPTPDAFMQSVFEGIDRANKKKEK